MATPDRWPPWIEPTAIMTVASSPFVVNSTTFAAIPGLTVTFTPHIATKLSIGVRVLAELAAAAGSKLLIRLILQAAGTQQRAVIHIPTVGNQFQLGVTFEQSLTLSRLAKETTYTVAVDAALDVAGSTYHILNSTGMNFTALGPIVAMPSLHS